MTKLNKFRCKIKYENNLISEIKTDKYDDILVHIKKLKKKFG